MLQKWILCFDIAQYYDCTCTFITFFSVWQHVDCMGVDRNNIPENYMCELCDPRRVDKQRAVQIQTRKRRELAHLCTFYSELNESTSRKM